MKSSRRSWRIARCPPSRSWMWSPAPSRPPWWSRRRFQWGIVVLLAVAAGLLLVAAESTEGGGGPIPLAQLVFVASVYVGLEITAVIIAFAFLRKWLGLFQ